MAIVDHGQVIALGSPARVDRPGWAASTWWNSRSSAAIRPSPPADSWKDLCPASPDAATKGTRSICRSRSRPSCCPALLARLAQCNGRLASLSTRHASLDDVFVTLTAPAVRAGLGNRRMNEPVRKIPLPTPPPPGRQPGRGPLARVPPRAGSHLSGSTCFRWSSWWRWEWRSATRPVETFRVAVKQGKLADGITTTLNRDPQVPGHDPRPRAVPDATAHGAGRPGAGGSRRIAAASRL